MLDVEVGEGPGSTAELKPGAASFVCRRSDVQGLLSNVEQI